MRLTRRPKYCQVWMFFLICSIIHVASVVSKGKQDENIVMSTTEASDINEQIPEESQGSHHDILPHLLNVGAAGAHRAIKGKEISLPPKKEVTSSESNAKTTEKDEKAHQEILELVFQSGAGGLHKSVKGKQNSQSSKKEPGTTLEPQVDTKIDSTEGVQKKKIFATNGTSTKGVIGGVLAPSTINANKEGKNISNCTPAAIKQFPRPLMGQWARTHGGIIVHIIVAVYMFVGLAIVCDEYFVASLDRICEELKMSPDVAGATFMAAGSSAPELATVVIGVFFAKDDIGISGVIGSAVFNIMFVIACCGLCSTAAVYLNWWPLIRDCFFYAVSILVMLIVIYNEEISWGESIVMILVYLVYCVVLHFNTPLEKWAQTWPVPFKQVPPNEQSGLMTYKTLEDTNKIPNYGMELSPEKQQEAAPGTNNFGMEWSPEKQQESFPNQLSGPDLNQATSDAPPNPASQPTRPNQKDYYRPKEYDPANQVNPLIKPEAAGYFALISWIVVFPIHWMCRKTMPDCRSEKYKRWYPYTFFISMLWISFYSYFMVWMITIIGYTMHIPDTVMGLTFVAAGVSVPDALSSIAVIKEGYGDMAVSNAVGSNVFDILICLGLPWFLKTAIISPGSKVRVISKGLTYSTLSLLSTVAFLVVATHMNGWKLDRRYGVILIIWYLIFITFASMYELNVFGEMNPPVCKILDGW